MLKLLITLLSIFFVSNYTLLAQVARHKPATFSYGGFQIDETQVCDLPCLEIERSVIRRQIDIVNHVGLSSEILEFFKSIPIILTIGDSSYAERYCSRSTERYVWGDIEINAYVISNSFLTNTYDISLLHELLHAFHDQRLPYGFDNQTIRNYYNDALDHHCYNWSLDASRHIENYYLGLTDSFTYYLTNEYEFFAVTASTYLFGYNTKMEPHLRQDIKEKQPQYYLYLQKIFAPAGSYDDRSWSGSAERYGLELEDLL